MDNTVRRNEAKRLLVHFCRLVEQRRQVPIPILECLRFAFLKALNGKTALSQALGLERGRGRPKLPHDQEQIQLAYAVLEERMSGSSYTDAVACVSDNFHRSETVVKNAFRALSQTVIWQFRSAHPKLTAEQFNRLKHISKRQVAKIDAIYRE